MNRLTGHSFLTVLLLFVLSFDAVAQKRGVGEPSFKKRRRGEEWTLDNRCALKVTPSSAFDSYGALLPLGFEYYFGQRYGFSFNVGLPMYYVINNAAGGPQKVVNSDFKVRLGIQQYFRLKEKSRWFFGTEASFRQQKMTLRDSYLRYVDGNAYTYSTVNATKRVYALGAYLGLARKFSEHFVADVYLGLGLRYLKMETNFDPAGLAPERKGGFSSLIPPNEDRVGDRDLNIYLPFAIKIGYLF